jgi:hypothetical protein
MADGGLSMLGQALRNQRLAHLAGAAGVVGQLASAYYFLLAPALMVPPPATYVFFGVWSVLVGLALAWWRDHPWRSFLLPIISTPAAAFTLGLGERFLGWAP